MEEMVNIHNGAYFSFLCPCSYSGLVAVLYCGAAFVTFRSSAARAHSGVIWVLSCLPSNAHFASTFVLL